MSSLLRVVIKLLLGVSLIVLIGCTPLAHLQKQGWRIGWFNPDGYYTNLDPHYNAAWDIRTGGIRVDRKF